MKPTERLRITPQPARPETKTADDADAAGRITQLTRQRVDLEAALRETRAVRSSGQLITSIDEQYKNLLNAATGAPAAGPEGTVVVRTVGLIQQKREVNRAPLEAVVVRLRIDNNEVAEEKTNAEGIAILRLPEQKAAAYEVEALDTKCKVLACERGRASSGHGSVHVFELSDSKALAPNFDRAKPWLKAAEAARSKAEELKTTVTKALKRQEEELGEMLGELDQMLEHCSRTAESKDIPQPLKKKTESPKRPKAAKPPQHRKTSTRRKT